MKSPGGGRAGIGSTFLTCKLQFADLLYVSSERRAAICLNLSSRFSLRSL